MGVCLTAWSQPSSTVKPSPAKHFKNALETGSQSTHINVSLPYRHCLSYTSPPSSTVKGSAFLWISRDVLAVRGQHPCGFHGMFWQSGVSIPVDFMGCFGSQGSAQYRGPGGRTGSQGSASQWISWDVLAVRGQHPCGFQGIVNFKGDFGSQGSASLWISRDVLAVKGQHPCGFHAMFWQSGVSALQGPRGQHWQSEVSILWGQGVSTGSQGSTLAVRGQHITGPRGQHITGPRGQHWQSGVSTLQGPRGEPWQPEVSILRGPGVSTGSQRSAHYRGPGGSTGSQGSAHYRGPGGSTGSQRSAHYRGPGGSTGRAQGAAHYRAQGAALAARGQH